MERVLEKMAKQLNSYDEASLMTLWQKYALQVDNFEATKKWEEAAIILCLIQSVHWKNQLFNHNLAEQITATEKPSFPMRPAAGISIPDEPVVQEKKRATILSFPSQKK